MSGNLSGKVNFNGEEVEFSGDVEEVTSLLLQFLTKYYPSLSIISDLVLTIDLESLLKSVKGVLAISEGEIVILVPKEELSDREHVLLILLKAYLENKLGLRERVDVSIGEVASISGEPKSTISGRLSELVNEGLVKRVERGKYKITPLGVKELTEKIIPEVSSAG